MPVIIPVISKSRHKGHQPYNKTIGDDQLKFVRQSPDNFEALLYLPAEAQAPDAGDTWLEEDLFSRPDKNQTVLAYQDPIAVCVLEQPRQQAPFDVEQSGQDQISDVEEYLMIYLDMASVPVGSALEWDDELSDSETRRTWWYVHHISTFGSTNAGALYYVIPLKDFTGLQQ